MNSEDELLLFGKHRGLRIAEVPIGYLRFMVQNSTPQAVAAEREMERRGTPAPEIELTAHAVDRASVRCWNHWREQRREDEGIYTWLARTAAEALKRSGPDRRGRYQYAGIKFAIGFDGRWPIVTTVVPLKNWRKERTP